MEVVYLRDCQFGFEGQVALVKPGFAEQVLIPKKIAVINFPGFKKMYSLDI
jgi:ribosomal protein L9